MNQTRKALILVFLGTVLLVGAVGCDSLNVLLNNIPAGLIFNLDQVGQVDLAGPRNLLIPENYPNWNDDPTCVIPGFCGPSIFYPFSTAPDAGTPISTSEGT